MRRRAVFLDRDGVLVREAEPPESFGYMTLAEQLEPIPGAIEGAQRLHALGFALIVVSNQGGVGRGLIAMEEIPRMEAKVRGWLAAANVPVLAFYHAFGAPGTEDPMRKPNPGMLLRAEAEHAIDLRGSYLVGDRESDMTAALRGGVQPLLVLTGKTHSEGYRDWSSQPIAVAPDLLKAAEWIARANDAPASGLESSGDQ